MNKRRNEVLVMDRPFSLSRERYIARYAPKGHNVFMRDGKVYAVTTGVQGDMYVATRLVQDGDVSMSVDHRTGGICEKQW